ncbi:MAG: AI-2E family transporter [Bacteroidota bacterium]
MISKATTIPFYAKSSIFLVGIIALVAILYIAQEIIVPIVFAIIIAILLSPVVNFFTRLKINRIIAISFTLLLTFIIIAIVGMILISQASQFSESWPILVDKFTTIINQSITWASEYFDINAAKIHAWILQTKGEIIDSSGSAIGQTLLSLGNGLVVLFLIPVYVFMILFYQPLILDFIHKLFDSTDKIKVGEIVTQIKTVIQQYLTGLIIEAIIVAVLDIGALLVLGIEYAVLLGIIGALLNLIPYIGGLVAVALPMMVAIATESSPWYALYVLILYYIIQLIDNNYIVPIIVSSKVKINALFSVIVVIAGNALWGVSGMFLSIPLLAITKLIFDHIESLKPWGFLFGDTMPSILKIKTILRKKKA